MDKFSECTISIITGASKGIGAEISKQLAGILPVNSLVIILARSVCGLTDVKKTLNECYPKVFVSTHACDLGKQTSCNFKTIIEQSILEYHLDINNFKRAVLVHNAGSLGDIQKKLRENSDTEVLKTFFELNIISMIALNSALFQVLSCDRIKKTVVNISSLLAIKPWSYSGLYCIAKAARDMMIGVIAIEEPAVKTLNYAPGPVDTEMQKDMRTLHGDHATRDYFSKLFADGKLVKPQDTVAVLIDLLITENFVSGSHVDYYDLVEAKRPPESIGSK